MSLLEGDRGVDPARLRITGRVAEKRHLGNESHACLRELLRCPEEPIKIDVELHMGVEAGMDVGSSRIPKQIRHECVVSLQDSHDISQARGSAQAMLGLAALGLSASSIEGTSLAATT